MALDSIKVALRGCSHSLTRRTSLFSNRRQRWGIRRKAVRAEHSVDLASYDEFPLGDLSVYHANAQRSNSDRAAFIDVAEIDRLAAHRVHVTPLYLAERGSRFP